MKAILEITQDDLNPKFLDLIHFLFKKNVKEITLKNEIFELEEFDKNLKIEDVSIALQKQGYNSKLINDIKKGLSNSTIYKLHDNKTSK